MLTTCSPNQGETETAELLAALDHAAVNEGSTSGTKVLGRPGLNAERG